MFSNWPPPPPHNVAILVPSTTRARAWIPVFGEALRNKLGIEATIVTAGRAPKEMPTASERLTTGKAHICFVTLGAGGVSEPVVALKRSYHLSYPFIFEHEGRVLMIPETSGNRTIELYEATTFPQAWSLRSVLVPNIDAADATVCQKDGRWWMFATVVAHGGSSWDSVSIFWADMLEGPWHSHPVNPVKYDVYSARPAGAFIIQEDRLLRPVQDCSQGYGSALAWCEVVSLTQTDFAERVVARQSCAAGSGYYGLHTYNRSTGFETVDSNVHGGATLQASQS